MLQAYVITLHVGHVNIGWPGDHSVGSAVVYYTCTAQHSPDRYPTIITVHIRESLTSLLHMALAT